MKTRRLGLCGVDDWGKAVNFPGNKVNIDSDYKHLSACNNDNLLVDLENIFDTH